MNKGFTTVLVATLSGCASHTGVISIGPDTFMIAKQQATGFPGLGNMKAEIIAEGNDKCRADGKIFQLVTSQESKPPYILGNYPRSEITFLCLSPGDPGLARPVMRKEPDISVEVKKE